MATISEATVALGDALLERGYGVEGGPSRFYALPGDSIGILVHDDRGVGRIEARELTLRHPELAALVAAATTK